MTLRVRCISTMPPLYKQKTIISSFYHFIKTKAWCPRQDVRSPSSHTFREHQPKYTVTTKRKSWLEPERRILQPPIKHRRFLCTSCVKAFKWWALLKPQLSPPSPINTILSLFRLIITSASITSSVLSSALHLGRRNYNRPDLFHFNTTISDSTVRLWFCFLSVCLPITNPNKIFHCIMPARCNHYPPGLAEWKLCGLIYCRRHLGERSPGSERKTDMREWRTDREISRWGEVPLIRRLKHARWNRGCSLASESREKPDTYATYWWMVIYKHLSGGAAGNGAEVESNLSVYQSFIDKKSLLIQASRSYSISLWTDPRRSSRSRRVKKLFLVFWYSFV